MFSIRLRNTHGSVQGVKINKIQKRNASVIPRPKEGVNWDDLSFSLTPTDYMYIATTERGKPFSNGLIQPYGPIPLYPSATVLSYGQGIFEGLKAFRTKLDRIVVFRPKDNSKRFNEGAKRFLMSEVPTDVFLHGVDSIVKANAHWVPPAEKGALYLRPLLFGSGAHLGVAPSTQYTFLIYASPVGSYFKAGKITPINLLATTTAHRAAPYGSGAVKAIGNYAPAFKAQKEAKEEGYNEVLFLDAKYDRFVEEAGASNFFCVTKDGVLRTPSLGTILEGVTRQSVLDLAKQNGIKFTIEKLDINQVMEAEEAFCTGTGASITPIGSITYRGKKKVFNNGEVGKVSLQMYTWLQDIQYERTHDALGWVHNPFKEE